MGKAREKGANLSFGIAVVLGGGGVFWEKKDVVLRFHGIHTQLEGSAQSFDIIPGHGNGIKGKKRPAHDASRQFGKPHAQAFGKEGHAGEGPLIHMGNDFVLIQHSLIYPGAEIIGQI